MLFATTFLLQLACAWFECELGFMAPYFFTRSDNSRLLVQNLLGNRQTRTEIQNRQDPLVRTKLGLIEGRRMKLSDTREIYSFTGVPYGESTAKYRFRPPVPKAPWRGVIKAKYPSPFCIQSNVMTFGQIRGEEEGCLSLDIFTPKIPDNANSSLLPVLMWIAAGANQYGKSRSYGPRYMLQEDVVFIPINVRCGIFGFLSTGDEFAPGESYIRHYFPIKHFVYESVTNTQVFLGNWALKDQALAVQFVHDHVSAFGGDPDRIVLGGMSSGGYAAHSMLFSNYAAKHYLSGIVSISGSTLANHGLDGVGRVRRASDMIAKEVGCPTSQQGQSKKMVECLRNMDPFILQSKLGTLYRSAPPGSLMLGPTLEPDVPSAFITELPEEQYKKGKVLPIPLIMTRTDSEDRTVFLAFRYTAFPLLSMRWSSWAPKLFQLFLRSSTRKATVEESQQSLLKVTEFYFNKSTPPNFFRNADFVQFTNLMDDGMYNAPMWKAIELHQKIAPCYAYINKQNTFSINPTINALTSFTELGGTHGSEYVYFFNNSRTLPPLPIGSDVEKASKKLINMLVNFAAYGAPLYRMKTGELIDAWKPVDDIRNPIALEVGLINEIKMIQDPIALSNRLKIWDKLKF
ncbi:Venom carboxylesterase-6 [Orchesella cincta]|uniref:Carboxylic ester hydrolase n=1 Tax=Orchesella cincta TaxID=48709 RepID=A0A1D2MWJ0_ORCCI|nr:Venom carboxylesterase-6 [Orchesella cincta]